MQRHNIKSRETDPESLDPNPIHIPGLEKPLTLKEEMQRFIRQQISEIAKQNDLASFEDEDDFDIPDGEEDPDLTSPYTVNELRPIGDQPIESLDGAPGEPLPETAEESPNPHPAEPPEPAE